MSELVEALYVGSGGYSLPNGTELVPGETIVEISAGEAAESENWQPVKAKKGGNGA